MSACSSYLKIPIVESVLEQLVRDLALQCISGNARCEPAIVLTQLADFKSICQHVARVHRSINEQSCGP